MAKQTINIGIRANDGKGDTLRAAFVKSNDNFTELYTNVSNNSNTANSQSANNAALAQGAFNKANSVFLGDISFTDTIMYSNTKVEVGNDHHNKKVWGLLYGQLTTQLANTYGHSVAYDSANNIYVALTTQNETTGYPQSTIVKFDTTGEIFWTRSVPANTSYGSYSESLDIDANNNVYLLTNLPNTFSTLVTKFNSVGQNVWSSMVEDAVGSVDITVDDQGFPYFVGEHNLLTGLDNTGELYFTYFTSQTASTNAFCCLALPNEDGVLVGSANGKVHKFSTEGVYRWTNNVAANGNTIISLTSDTSNNWYAASNTNIYKFRSNNELLWEKTITGITTPKINWIKHKNDYLYVNGATTDANNQTAFITYKIDANGALVWARSLEIASANQTIRLGHRQLDVSGDYLVGIGYSKPSGKSNTFATVYQLPVDGSLSGTYLGANGSSWGNFTYVGIPEANTATSTTVGTGNTTVTIAENTNYTYTTNVIVYSTPGGLYEKSVTPFKQKWQFDSNGKIIVPSSGDPTALDLSGKNIVNTGNVIFNNGTSQRAAALPLANLKVIVAASSSFADFQSRIAAL
jgi:hypothetical protein